MQHARVMWSAFMLMAIWSTELPNLKRHKFFWKVSHSNGSNGYFVQFFVVRCMLFSNILQIDVQICAKKLRTTSRTGKTGWKPQLKGILLGILGTFEDSRWDKDATEWKLRWKNGSKNRVCLGDDGEAPKCCVNVTGLWSERTRSNMSNLTCSPCQRSMRRSFECSSLDQVLFFPFKNCRKSKDRTLKLSMTGEESAALLPLLAPSEGIPESGKIWSGNRTYRILHGFSSVWLSQKGLWGAKTAVKRVPVTSSAQQHKYLCSTKFLILRETWV